MSSASRQFRLASSRRISAIFRDGQRVRDRRAAMAALPNGLDHCRIAYAVGRRAHGNAVHRNRVRRLCREGFRRVRGDLPAGLDLVFIPLAGEAHSVAAFAESIQRLTRRLADRLAPADRVESAKARTTERAS